MKKSKIIIPALAIIAFSTAASIAGSVAWFTASRTANISAGTFAVVKTSADLAYKVEEGAATTVSGNTVVFDGLLTDGSVNHKTAKAYTPNESGKTLSTDDTKKEIDLTADADASAITALETKLSRGQGKDGSATKTIYTAATFKVSFTITFGSIDTNIGLYLNTKLSAVSVNGGADPLTAKGFRMAFMPYSVPEGSSGKATVFADLQKTTDTSVDPAKTNIKYIKDLTDANLSGTEYVASEYDLIDTDYNKDLPSTGTLADYTNRQDYLGTFKFAAGTQVTLSYRVACWFEGTDPEIVNRTTAAEYQKVAAALQFDAVNLPAA